MQGMRKLKALVVMALVGLMALAVAGQASAGLSGEGSPLSPYTGNIRGTITDGNGEPVEEIEVCAMTEQTNPAITYCATTEQGGEYLIYNVPQQGFKVWAQSLTYIHGWPQGYPQIFYPGVPRYEEATWVQVHAEQTTTGIDFQVHEGGEITGIVTDAETGEPVSTVEVCSTRVGEPERAEVQQCAISDAAGNYTIQNVDTNEYTVAFSTRWEPAYEAAEYAEPVSVTAGQTTAGIDAHLNRIGGGEAASGATSTSGTAGTSGGQTPGAARPVTVTPTATIGAGSPDHRVCKRGFRKAAAGRSTRCVKIHKRKAAHPVARATRR